MTQSASQTSDHCGSRRSHRSLWLVITLLPAAVLGVTAPRKAAAQVTWTGTSSDWALSTNWTPTTTLANSGTYSLVFAGTPTAVSSSNSLSSLTLGTGTTTAIRFNTSGFTLVGNAITLSSTIANLAATGTNTINLDMSVGSTRSISGTAGSTLVLGGDISGAGGLTFSRTAGATVANFILSGSNDFTGGFTVTGAGATNLTITDPNAFGRDIASNKLTFSETTITNNAGALVRANNVDFNANSSRVQFNLAGGSLELTGSTAFLGSNGTGITANSGTLTIRQISTGSGVLGGQLGGSGTIIVSQSSSGYTGNWRTSTGTGWVLIGDAAALGSGTFQFATANAMGLGTTRDLTISTNLSTSVAGGRIGGDYALTVDKPIVGSGGLSKVGSGTLSLTANNTFSGVMSVSQGVLRLTGSNSLSGVTLNGTTSGISAVSFESANALGTSGSLTYSGVTNGTATIRNASGAPLTLASTGAFTTNNLGTLAFDGPSPLTISASTWFFQMATINVVSSTLTLAGSGTGTAATQWTKTGAGTLRLSGSNSFAGSQVMQIGDGVVLLDNQFALPGGTGVRGSGAPVRFTGGPGGVLGLTSGTFALVIARGTNSGGVAFNDAGGGNPAAGGFAGFASGSTVYVALTVGGTTGGTLQFGATTDFLASGTTLILGAPNATGTVDFQNPLNLNNAQQFVRVDDGAAAVDAIVSGVLSNGSLTKRGGGTLVLTGSSTLSGTLTIGEGVLLANTISGTSSANPLGQGTLALGSGTTAGTLRYTGTAVAVNRPITLGGSVGGVIEANGSGALNLSAGVTAAAGGDKTLYLSGSNVDSNSLGPVSNPSGAATSVIKQGSGRWVLTATSAYTGSTTVDQGQLVLGVNQSGPGAGALGNGGSLTVGNSSGSGTAALLLKSGVQIDSRTLTIPAVSSGSQVVILGGADSSGTATFGNDGSMTVSVGRDVTLQAATGGTVVFNNAWSNGTGRNVTIGTAGNAGTVRFDGSANGLTTTGTVFVNVGTLSAGAGGLPGPTALIVTSTLSAVDYNSAAPLTVNSAGRATISGAGLSLAAVTNNNTTADSVDFTDNTGTITLAGLTGAGSTRFRGGASIGGTLSQGTVTIDGVGTLQTVSGGTLGLGGSSASITTLSGGRVNLSNGVALSVEAGTFADSITGNGTLTKTTAGKLTLAGSNSYSGATAVSAGTLAVDGSIASAVTVAGGATLGGSGRVAANIGGDGLIAPGNSPGILQVDGQVIPTSLTAFAFEFTSTGSPNWANATASVNDVLRLTNADPFASVLAATNTVSVYFDVASLANGDIFRGGFFSDKTSGQLNFASEIGSPNYVYYVYGDGGGSATTYNGRSYYTLAQYDPSLTGATVTVVNAGTASFANGTVTDGQVTQFVVVPEPATLALAAVGICLGGFAAFRRRR